MTKNFFLYLWPSLIQTVGGIFVVVPITTFYLDPADIGLVAVLTAIAMPIGPLASSGDMWVLSGHWHITSVEERKDLLFNVVLANLLLKLFWVVVFWFLASSILPMVLRDFQLLHVRYFGFVLVGLLLNTLWSTVSFVMVLEEHAALNAANEVAQWVAGAASTVICLAVFKLGLVSLLISPIVVGLVSLGLCLWYLAPRVRPALSRAWLKEVFQKGLPVIPFNLTEVIANSLDRVLIQRWLDLHQLGLYAHSQTYRGVFVTATKAYSRTMTPVLLASFAGDSRSRSEDLSSKQSLWYSAACIGGIMVALFAPEIVHLIGHGKFDGAAPLVPIWYFLVLTQSFGLPYTQYVLHVKQNRLLSLWSVVGNLLTMLLLVGLTWAFGIVGAAWAGIIGSLVLSLCRFYLAQKFGSVFAFEKRFLAVVSLLGAAYFLTQIVALPLVAKVVVGALTLVVLALHARKVWTVQIVGHPA